MLRYRSQSTNSFLKKLLNRALANESFPDKVKLADITPNFEKRFSNKTKNYWPVSALC